MNRAGGGVRLDGLPRYVVAPRLRIRAGDDGGVMVAMGGSWLGLNAASALIVASCRSPCTIGEMIHDVCRAFPDQKPAGVGSDVIEGLGELMARRIIIEHLHDDASLNDAMLITGCARSGTSALVRGLSTHPAFCLFNEYNLFAAQGARRDAWRRIMASSLNHPPAKVAASIGELKSRMARDLPIATDNVTTLNWLLAQCETRPVVYGDKMPLEYLADMKGIARRMPGARFLVTVRDGRAVIASQLRYVDEARRAGKDIHAWMGTSIDECQGLWRNAMGMWLEMREDPPAPCLEVRYEDAVRDPRAMVRRICRFTGVAYESEAFETFICGYGPVHVDAWREELPDIETHLSADFIALLRALDYH